MLTKNEFQTKFINYSDEDLIGIVNNIDNFSEEAKEAFHNVLDERGGLERLLKLRIEKMQAESEAQRIRIEVIRISGPGVDESFVKKMITSGFLTRERVEEIIDDTLAEIHHEKEDKKLKPRTFVGSAAGAGISSIVGGILWGIQLIYLERIFIIVVVGLAVISYLIINATTKQTYKNPIVLFATVVAIVTSISIGWLLFEFIGKA